MNKFFFVSLLLICNLNFCQDKVKKYKFNFQFDNRFSSIRDYNITIFGAKVGVQYKNLMRFGVGASFIVNPVDISGTLKITRRKNSIVVPTEEKISFWYFSVYNDWILYKSKHWECFVTEQIGYGTPVYIGEVNNVVVRDQQQSILVNEISAQINYKIFSWMGVGTGIGYRNIWNGDSEIKNTFNAPIYSAKLIIYPESIFSK